MKNKLAIILMVTLGVIIGSSSCKKDTSDLPVKGNGYKEKLKSLGFICIFRSIVYHPFRYKVYHCSGGNLTRYSAANLTRFSGAKFTNVKRTQRFMS